MIRATIYAEQVEAVRRAINSWREPPPQEAPHELQDLLSACLDLWDGLRLVWRGLLRRAEEGLDAATCRRLADEVLRAVDAAQSVAERARDFLQAQPPHLACRLTGAAELDEMVADCARLRARVREAFQAVSPPGRQSGAEVSGPVESGSPLPPAEEDLVRGEDMADVLNRLLSGGPLVKE
jgi:hypothetical protein